MGEPIPRRHLMRLAAATLATGSVGVLLAHCEARGPSSESPVAAHPSPPPGVSPRPSPGPSPVGRTGVTPAPVPEENLLPGALDWELALGATPDAAAYVDAMSVMAGDRLRLFVSSRLPSAVVFVYRLGWYGGLGARQVMRVDGVRLVRQPPPVSSSSTGLIRAPWAPTMEIDVPPEWVSGLYLVRVKPFGGRDAYATFVVRERDRVAPILVVSAALTAQAYNTWGGKSLYPSASSGEQTEAGSDRATKVSFDRPHAKGRGSGYALRWEYPFTRWLERQAPGYDVAYCADADLELHPGIVVGRRLVVFVGHPEYWTAAMRRNVEGARDLGTNLAFLSANECYWRVRLEPGASGPARTLVCYRSAALDPMTTRWPELATVKWRQEPGADPESRLMGQMYGHVVRRSAPFVCTAPSHWLYEGTGMASGDAIGGLVGQEYDRWFPDEDLQPPGGGVQVLARSPVEVRWESGVPGAGEPSDPVANATIHTTPWGATTFSAGTIHWSWGLDAWGWPTERYEGDRLTPDVRVMRMTRNVLDRLGG